MSTIKRILEIMTAACAVTMGIAACTVAMGIIITSDTVAPAAAQSIDQPGLSHRYIPDLDAPGHFIGITCVHYANGDSECMGPIPEQRSATIFIPPGTPNLLTRGTPSGTAYHQVVDRYFDAEGKELATQSATHAYDPLYCQPGHRPEDRQELTVMHDDGHGNVTFAGNEQFGPEVPAAESKLAQARLGE